MDPNELEKYKKEVAQKQMKEQGKSIEPYIFFRGGFRVFLKLFLNTQFIDSV